MVTTSTCSSGDASTCTLDVGIQFPLSPMELAISVRQGGLSSDFTLVRFLVPEIVDVDGFLG